MKKILLGLTLLSVNAMAIDQNSSWEEIHNDYDLNVHEATIKFDGSYVSIFNVCHVNNTQLRTVRPITLYKWDGDYHVPAGKGLKERSINYRSVVVDGDGTRWEDETYPLTYNVKVSVETNSDGAERVLFRKPYTIPACE